MNEKTLECSTSGDKRFSAMVAKVSVNGVLDTIENHYQKSKVFLDKDGYYYTVNTSKDAKGKKPVAFKIGDYYLPLSYGAMFYDLLWYKYLKANPALELVLEQYDDYSDKYKSKKAYNCQADSIRKYMRENGVLLSFNNRGKSILRDCKPLLDVLRKTNTVIIEQGDLLEGYTNIIAHQVNCQAVMGKGIAKSIRTKYPQVYDSYIKFCKDNKKLLGKAQIINLDNKYICNLYAQEYYGLDKTTTYTSYEALRASLMDLKDYAKENNLTVGLPYEMGCGLANGDWNIVLNIIKDVFKDYYVIIYKL